MWLVRAVIGHRKFGRVCLQRTCRSAWEMGDFGAACSAAMVDSDETRALLRPGFRDMADVSNAPICNHFPDLGDHE